VLLRIAMRNDLGAYRMKPFVAIGVIEMPMRIDQMGNGSTPRSERALVISGRRHANAASMRTLPQGR